MSSLNLQVSMLKQKLFLLKPLSEEDCHQEFDAALGYDGNNQEARDVGDFIHTAVLEKHVFLLCSDRGMH